jgi:hypothetical protein
MVMHHLGVHRGNELGGYEAIGGGEAIGLARLSEKATRIPGGSLLDIGFITHMINPKQVRNGGVEHGCRKRETSKTRISTCDF